MQNGFCTNFFRFRGKKLLTDKCTEKCTEKRTEKRNVFTEFFHRNFPRIFGVCFSAVRTVNATEKRPPKNQPENPSRHRAKSRVPMWQRVEASQHAHLRSKNDPEKPKISSACSSAPLCLPIVFFGLSILPFFKCISQKTLFFLWYQRKFKQHMFDKRAIFESWGSEPR